MEASRLYIPGWLILFSLSLSFIASSSKDSVFCPAKLETACKMTKYLYCYNAFFKRIATACGHKKAGSSHGIACKQSRVCRVKMSKCYKRICLCQLGLYFSPKQNTCLQECDEYGNEMDVYNEAGIGGHNDQVYCNTTLTSCFNLCVRETAFTCRTIEWKTDGKCNLSKSGFRDVGVFDRLFHEKNWKFGQRRCK